MTETKKETKKEIATETEKDFGLAKLMKMAISTVTEMETGTEID